MPKITISSPEQEPQGYRFALDRPNATIGRGAENDIVINSESISTQHAEMRRVPGGYELHDLGSINGIKYQGTSMPAVTLQPGLELELGDAIFYFELGQEEWEALEAEKAQIAAPAPAPVQQQPAVSLQKAAPRRNNSYQPPVRKPRYEFKKDSAGMGFTAILVFLLCVALAFFVGMFIRHNNDTGVSIITAILNKGQVAEEEADKTQSAPPVETPAPAAVAPVAPTPAPAPTPAAPAPVKEAAPAPEPAPEVVPEPAPEPEAEMEAEPESGMGMGMEMSE